MLFQVIEGREVPVAFWSKAFTATERRWSTYEQKTFAFVASVLHWESLLLGHQFSVEIDHKHMLWVYKSDTPKVVRWRLRLAPFDFDINHSGQHHPRCRCPVSFASIDSPRRAATRARTLSQCNGPGCAHRHRHGVYLEGVRVSQ
jgi:hypothetical protein